MSSSSNLLVLLLIAGLSAFEEIDPKWLEKIMIREGKKGGIFVEKLTSLQLSPADPPSIKISGSNRTRADMKLKLRSGDIIDKSVMIIEYPSDPVREKQIAETRLFEVDINVYENVLPRMDELLRKSKFADEGKKLWVKAYELEKFTRLVLDDVKAAQYLRRDRWDGLNMEECKLSMRYLAKFHALSVVLHDRHLIPTNQFDLALGQKNRHLIGDWHGNVLKEFANTIRAAWGNEWEEAADIFDEEAKTVTQKRMDLFVRDDSKFNVLNIGFYYINSIYLKHERRRHGQTPVGVKAINFQTAFLNSPAFDIQLFINTTPAPDLIADDRKRDEILREYADAIGRYLKEFGYKNPFNFHDLQAEMRRTEYIGLTDAINHLSGVYAKPGDEPYAEQFIIDALKSKGIKIDTRGMIAPRYIEVMKKLVLRAKKLGIIKSKIISKHY